MSTQPDPTLAAEAQMTVDIWHDKWCSEPVWNHDEANPELVTAITTLLTRVREEERERWVKAADLMEECVGKASKLPQWSYPVAQTLIPGRDALYLLRQAPR